MDRLIKKIIHELNKNGFEAYIVGGYVRDKVLNIDSDDIDICTNALPKDVIRILKLNNKTSVKYGSISFKTKKYNIDITTYRKEYDYNKHEPTSTIFVNDLKTDLKRRDFTCNTLLMDKNNKIIDYYDGLKDIKNKVIKCIGSTNKKLKEDPLRILRAIRISVIYDFNIDNNILNFIDNNKDLINEISFFRKKEELDKILISKNCIKGLNLIKNLNLCDALGINYNNIIYTKDLIGMYAQIEFNNRYTFTKSENSIIKDIREIVKNGSINNKTIYKYGLYINKVAGEILNIDYKRINKLYNNLPIKTRKDIKINIKSIVKINNNCYNNINKIYLDLEDKILSGILRNNTRDIINYLRK